METANLFSLILQKSLVAQLVFGTLILGIIYSLYWVITNILQYLLLKKYHQIYLKAYSTSEDLAAYVDQLNTLKLPFSSSRFGAGSTLVNLLNEIEHPSDSSVEQRFRLANEINIAKQTEYVQTNTPLVSLIATISPYVGLLGTVWGIITSFTGLSQVEQISLIAIAPGIAEALLATLIGLLCFLVATSSVRLMAAKFDGIFDEMLSFENALVLNTLKFPLPKTLSLQLHQSGTIDADMKPSSAPVKQETPATKLKKKPPVKRPSTAKKSTPVKRKSKP